MTTARASSGCFIFALVILLGCFAGSKVPAVIFGQTPSLELLHPKKCTVFSESEEVNA
jgi:hypothetical protein